MSLIQSFGSVAHSRYTTSPQHPVTSPLDIDALRNGHEQRVADMKNLGATMREIENKKETLNARDLENYINAQQKYDQLLTEERTESEQVDYAANTAHQSGAKELLTDMQKALKGDIDGKADGHHQYGSSIIRDESYYIAHLIANGHSPTAPSRQKELQHAVMLYGNTRDEKGDASNAKFHVQTIVDFTAKLDTLPKSSKNPKYDIEAAHALLDRFLGEQNGNGSIPLGKKALLEIATHPDFLRADLNKEARSAAVEEFISPTGLNVTGEHRAKFLQALVINKGKLGTSKLFYFLPHTEYSQDTQTKIIDLFNRDVHFSTAFNSLTNETSEYDDLISNPVKFQIDQLIKVATDDDYLYVDGNADEKEKIMFKLSDLLQDSKVKDKVFDGDQGFAKRAVDALAKDRLGGWDEFALEGDKFDHDSVQNAIDSGDDSIGNKLHNIVRGMSW